jgi:hypothetical protein
VARVVTAHARRCGCALCIWADATLLLDRGKVGLVRSAWRRLLGERTVRRFRNIAADNRIARTHGSGRLPRSWGTLGELE